MIISGHDFQTRFAREGGQEKFSYAVALNLLSIGYIFERSPSFIGADMYWIDGVTAQLLVGGPRYPGRMFLDNVLRSGNWNLIVACSNAELISRRLSEIYNANLESILPIELPYDSAPKLAEAIQSSIGLVQHNTLILIGVSSPKQEETCFQLKIKLRRGKALCVGGALNMIAGLESPCPKWISSIGLEGIWRIFFSRNPRHLYRTAVSLYRVFKVILTVDRRNR